MSKKYEITSQSIEWYGKKLFRIKALKSFNDVKAGDLGGYIENEINLSHNGTAWIYDEAKVFSTARICGNANVHDKAIVCGNAVVLGNAKILDNTMVYDNASISGNAKILGNSSIFDNTKVYGNASVSDAKIYGSTKIY